MADADRSLEQQQILVEIEAVAKAIGDAKASNKAYEVAQGRDLIEKAQSLGLPADSYAKLSQAVDGAAD